MLTAVTTSCYFFQALETARTANRRLREEVTASTEELAAIKTQQGEDARRHSQGLVAAKSALDEVRHRLEALRGRSLQNA